jgi:plastocyanin
MNTRPLIVGSLSVIGMAFLLNACQPTTPPTPPPPPPPPGSNACPNSIEIAAGDVYEPLSCTIKLNGAPKTITIRANAGHPFQIVGTWPFSTVNNPNQDQVVTFTAPGVYKFYCSFHGFPSGTNDVGGMSGTITVEN